MNKKTKGIVSELIVAARLINLGFNVSQPIGDNCGYDLVLDISNKFYRLQCRTAWLKQNASVLEYNTRSCRINTKQTYVVDSRLSCDFFTIYSPDLDRVYVVKSSDAPKGSGKLRLFCPSGRKISYVKLANDFLLSKESFL